jgi:hypothetical protein
MFRAENRVFRCRWCGKILNSKNKIGMCSACYIEYYKRELQWHTHTTGLEQKEREE